MGTRELMGTQPADLSHPVAEIGADPGMAVRKLNTRGFRSGSPMSRLVPSLISNACVVW